MLVTQDMSSPDLIRRPCSSRPPDVCSGFTLTEVLVALLISVITVVGLAHTFGIGRGLIDRYATSRDALGAAERRIETLQMQAMQDSAANFTDLTPGSHGPIALTLNGRTAGVELWLIESIDDTADGISAADVDHNTDDYRLATVRIGWTQAAVTDTLRLTTILPSPQP
ncbi:MAG: prepilin-type N-terminal cleavage/methylation domain-containing protein [Candidatus Eisenbacteria bacterium]|uniref:Prepilin-type N-terminal cleavage/methylation domain-containing protein n=1 Tax=Eiseniibacteriota bacterium TaxID=2212470 RepID=A0A849SJ99_UNCEI|nr:prepilin-type N-terminal cleavage/methylation domain-containing protein [Candidatus Eisenbacteria bacterium]